MTRWTAADVERTGLRVAATSPQGVHAATRPTPVVEPRKPYVAPAPAAPAKVRAPNRWEARYLADVLLPRHRAGEITDPLYEALRLRLGPVGERCWWTPDWCAWRGSVLEVHEVKGFMRDDARVKLMTAARCYPAAEVYLGTREGGAWRVRRVA